MEVSFRSSDIIIESNNIGFNKGDLQGEVIEDFNGIEEYCYFTANNNTNSSERINNSIKVTEKFDSAASNCMSGVEGRIEISMEKPPGVSITGFNGNSSQAQAVGLNIDGKKEYYVPQMPRDLALLCAQVYASEGAAILLKNEGVVLRLTDEEVEDLKKYLSDYPIIKKLIVKNRTYEVDNNNNINKSNLYGIGYSNSAFMSDTVEEEEAFSNAAAKFFNTKVHVSNKEDRVLTMLMTGLSFSDIYSHVKNGSLGGMPPDLTMHSLNRFEHIYGKTPDIIRLATPLEMGNRRGLMADSDEIKSIGQRIEIDIMESDYNNTAKADVKDGKVKKLPSHGGAIACAVCVDTYSGFTHGKLLKTTGKTKVFIEEFIQHYELDNVTIKLLASDSGVVSQTMFEVWTPEAEKMLLSKKIISERAEPYNHQRGTPTVERTIRMIKELIRIAVMFILRNPNFETFGFTKVQILKLWGELFNWSIAVINLKPCPRLKGKTRYEVFKKKQPNMQSIRILPIFSVVLVLRKVPSKGSQANQLENQIALYVGPSMKTIGAIRAAIVTEGQVRVLVTSRFTAATNGGGLNIHQHVARGLSELIAEQPNETAEDDLDVEVTPESDSEPVNSPLLPVIEAVVKASIEPIVQDIDNESIKEVNWAPLPVVKKKRKSKKKKALQQDSEPQAKAPVHKNMVEKSPAVTGYDKYYPKANEISSREERAKDRGERRLLQANVAETSEELETACLADWSNYEDSLIFWSWANTSFLEVAEFDSSVEHVCEEGYKAVTENVPRTYAQALVHPKWGDAARKEWNTLTSTKAIVEVDKEMAIDSINNHGADLVLLFPVYEEKIKDGEVVFKVRLVGDGRTHHNAGNTYSATPSREEFLIVLHVIGALGWSYAHVDEIRAFLNAGYKGEKEVFTKFRHEDRYFKILSALYGLKTSPRDYQDTVAERLLALGYTRLHMCGCIYIAIIDKDIVIVYDYVDDFVFAGNNKTVVQAKIEEMRSVTSTTEPIWDAEYVLGMEISRDYGRKIICVKMEKKIEELCERFDICDTKKFKEVPMPTVGYVVKDYEFETMSEEKQAFLTKDGIAKYMAIVGSLIWISGIRLDILFAVMYLSWSTRNPRQHHMDMALYCLSYLFRTKDLPLVLGGDSELQIIGYTDASLGTGPKGRSITGQMIKLNERAGAISAKAHATQGVFTASFEAELDGTASAMKSISRVSNILTELRLKFAEVSLLWSDNVAMINFVHGKGVAKGVRHMELRMWYVREKYKKGNIVLDYMAGEIIPADKLTKLGNKVSHIRFRDEILGLGLLD